jgi:NAD(P)-dependent dehydrogenase (short-subunit alcohol dehydrogenase family)
MRELRGRTAVVTGAASGIGRALCVAFAQQGCRIVLADIERAPLEAAADELRAAGAECLAVPTDVADADSVAALADAAVRAFGGVHIAVNNAGVSVRKPMAEFTLDDWRWTLGVDLWGTIHGVHAFLPLLREQPEAHLVNTASVAGLTPFPLGGAYNAAKAAVVALTETLFLELQAMAPHVGVSVLCPGATRSNFVSSARNRPVAGAERGQRRPDRPGHGAGEGRRARHRGDPRAALLGAHAPGRVRSGHPGPRRGHARGRRPTAGRHRGHPRTRLRLTPARRPAGGSRAR